jgi:hypothetical protein
MDGPDFAQSSSGGKVTDPVQELQSTQRAGIGENTETTLLAPALGVLIHYRVGSASGRYAARRIAQEVRRFGLDVMEVRAEPSVPTMREVLYASGEAAAEAERLARRLRNRWGNAWRVQTRERPSLKQEHHEAEPRSTLSALEVWLPHR